MGHNISIYSTNQKMTLLLIITTALLCIISKAKTYKDENEKIYQTRLRDTLREKRTEAKGAKRAERSEKSLHETANKN